MPRYIVLYKFTDQGAKNIRSTVERAKTHQAECERLGFKILDMYWTQGQYDVVVIMEAPDEEMMIAGLLNASASGNIRSETLRAFSAAESGPPDAARDAVIPGGDGFVDELRARCGHRCGLLIPRRIYGPGCQPSTVSPKIHTG